MTLSFNMSHPKYKISRIFNIIFRYILLLIHFVLKLYHRALNLLIGGGVDSVNLSVTRVVGRKTGRQHLHRGRYLFVPHPLYDVSLAVIGDP